MFSAEGLTVHRHTAPDGQPARRGDDQHHFDDSHGVFLPDDVTTLYRSAAARAWPSACGNFTPQIAASVGAMSAGVAGLA